MENKFNNRWQGLSKQNILLLAPEGAVFYLAETEGLFGGYVRGEKGSYEFSNGGGVIKWEDILDRDVFENGAVDLEDLRAEMEVFNYNSRGEGI